MENEKLTQLIKRMKDYYLSNLDGENNKFSLKSLQKALTQLFLNLKYDKSIIVYGDYDADGILSSSIFYAYLKKAKEKIGNHSKVDITFSDRKTFFGMNKEKYDELSQKYGLIIMTDNGSDEDFLNENINNLLIFDHHPTDNEYAYIVNPNIHTSKYSTSGGKVVFDFLQILDVNLKKHLGISVFEDKNLFNIFKELAAMTIISDMANLTENNRKFVIEALETMPEKKLPMFYSLNEFNSSTIGFNLIPKINAMSRMEEDLNIVFKWVFPVSRDEFIFADKYIEKVNNKKKDIVLSIYNSITKEQFNENLLFIDNNIVFLQDKNEKITVKPGLAGLLANKFLNEFNKPAIVVTKEREYYIGSARGKNIKGFFNKLKEQNPDFFSNGGYGGHLDAMGFRTTDIKDLELIKNNIHTYKYKYFFDVLDNNPLKLNEYAVLKNEYNKIAQNVDFHKKAFVLVENNIEKLDKKAYANYTLYASSKMGLKFLIPNQKTQEFEECNYFLIKFGVGDIESVQGFLDGVNDIDYKVIMEEKKEIKNENIIKENIKNNEKVKIK